MKLGKYLKKCSILKSHFALDVGISPAFVTYIIQGKRRPSPEVAQKIENVTHGMVTRMEVLYPKE